VLEQDIRIVEVGPRDGLQSEGRTLDAAVRIGFVEALLASGLGTVEVGSFVSPRWIPQMAGSDAVLRGLGERPEVRLPVLVPNVRGMELAVAAGAREIALFVAASETFSRRNINCSIGESFERAAPVLEIAEKHGITVRGYLSSALGCPYEGPVAVSAVVDVAKRLADIGCYEISVSDTIGVGTPRQARSLLEAVAGSVPMRQLAVHFHDTYGQALANVLACIEAGVRVVDAAAGGLGGCPYAKGASGNLATEDLVYMLSGMGMETMVDLDRLLDAVAYISRALDAAPRSKVFAALRGVT
jgi:hydroxymethylglutaryl-CoA lyase